MSVARPIRVFVSYRHESQEHVVRVRALSDQLRRDGVDAIFDRYFAAPEEGWSWWVERELAMADRVIVVCSASYLASAHRDVDGVRGHGTSWEWHLIRKEFYDSRGAGGRITPVFFDQADEEYVPSEAGDRPRYCVADLGSNDYRRLLNDLFRLAEVEPPALGAATVTDERMPQAQPREIQSTGTGVRDGLSPRVYISYTHDSTEHKTWVAELAERLYYDGVDVTFDNWFMEPGVDLWARLETEVARADVVVLICTPAYRAKATGIQEGGLKREYDRVVTRSKAEDTVKVIPVLCMGDWDEAVPPEFSTRFGYVLRGRSEFDFDAYTNLRRALLGQWSPGPARGIDESAPVLDSGIESSNPDTDAGPRQEVILLIHGIRTFASWQPLVKRLLEEIPGTRVVPIKYGYLDAFRFWFPLRTRQAPIDDIRREIQNARAANDDSRISVIAHSFGTYAISQILLENPDLRLERLILLGSIVPRSYRWDYVRSRLATDVVNDYGTRDIWPVLAKCLSWGYGDTGRHGFGRGAHVYDRGHNFAHSDFFTETFVRKYWIPWFEEGRIVSSEWEESAPPSPWWINVLSILPLQWFTILALAVSLIWLCLTVGPKYMPANGSVENGGPSIPEESRAKPETSAPITAHLAAPVEHESGHVTLYFRFVNVPEKFEVATIELTLRRMGPPGPVTGNPSKQVKAASYTLEIPADVENSQMIPAHIHLQHIAKDNYALAAVCLRYARPNARLSFCVTPRYLDAVGKPLEIPTTGLDQVIHVENHSWIDSAYAPNDCVAR